MFDKLFKKKSKNQNDQVKEETSPQDLISESNKDSTPDSKNEETNPTSKTSNTETHKDTNEEANDKPEEKTSEPNTKSQKEPNDSPDKESKPKTTAPSEEPQVIAKMVTKSGTATLPNTQALANKIEAQLANHSHQDYWTFRIRKSSFFLATGVAILTVWMVPLGQWFISSGKAGQIHSNFTSLIHQFESNQATNSESDTNNATPSANLLKIERESIRVRVKSSNDNIIAPQIIEAMKVLGYENIDFVTEENTTTGIEIAAKPNQTDLRAFLIADLDGFTLASSSAELTQDSDFDIVIIVGETQD